MKKITKATFKSFIRKNRQALLVKVKSSFCGMSDMVEQIEDDFDPAEDESHFGPEHSCGISGVYLVGGSRDYFTAYETETHIGIEFSNCCGSGIVAIAKKAAPVAPEPIKETPKAEKVKVSTKSECTEAVDSFYWLVDYITGGTTQESIRQAKQGILDLEAKAAKVAELMSRGGKLVKEDSHLQDRAARIPARVELYRERYCNPAASLAGEFMEQAANEGDPIHPTQQGRVLEMAKEAPEAVISADVREAAENAVKTLLDSGLTATQLRAMTHEEILRELRAVTRRNAFSIVA